MEGEFMRIDGLEVDCQYLVPDKPIVRTGIGDQVLVAPTQQCAKGKWKSTMGVFKRYCSSCEHNKFKK